jgi:hypothetical protein
LLLHKEGRDRQRSPNPALASDFAAGVRNVRELYAVPVVPEPDIYEDQEDRLLAAIPKKVIGAAEAMAKKQRGIADRWVALMAIRRYPSIVNQCPLVVVRGCCKNSNEQHPRQLSWLKERRFQG